MKRRISGLAEPMDPNNDYRPIFIHEDYVDCFAHLQKNIDYLGSKRLQRCYTYP